MSFGDKMKEIEARAKVQTAETKKDVKDAWADTKASAEKTKNDVESRIDQM